MQFAIARTDLSFSPLQFRRLFASFSGCAAGTGQALLTGVAVLVLVVDDSPDARALYGEYLEFCGFRVQTASDGEEAVQKAQAEWPAVILMDLAMPKVDGWEAIRRLRADPMTAGIPIVALSAYAFGDEPERARGAGADLCLTKPCLPSQVGRVIRAMLLRRDVARPSA